MFHLGIRISDFFRISDFGFRISVLGLRFCTTALSFAACLSASAAAPTNATAPPEPEPVTARDCFNAGTRQLRDGKLREAEALLQDALARQEAKLQPPALYNLGHVRFGQGKEELKKSLSAEAAGGQGRTATRRAAQAIDRGVDALGGNDLQKLVLAYLNGRGARRQLLAATAAVSRALETHGAALRKWQRALGDFRGAAELNPADTNAQHNAECVEREIARLVDSLRELQQMAAAMGATQPELDRILQQLKGRIPQSLMPPGAAGEEEDEGEAGQGTRPDSRDFPTGSREGPAKEGAETIISPEAARWLLEAFNPDGNRRLPMGMDEQAQPKDRNRRNW